MQIYKINDKLLPTNGKIYKANYINAVLSNLMAFVNKNVKTTEIEAFGKHHGLLLYNQPKKIALENIEEAIEYANILLEQESIAAFMEENDMKITLQSCYQFITKNRKKNQHLEPAITRIEKKYKNLM